MPKVPIEQAVEDLLEVRDDLCNAWEWDFIDNMSWLLERKDKLTEKQEEIVWKLYDRACKSSY